VREIGAGETCDPGEPASIASAIEKILHESPAARQSRRARCWTAARMRYNWPHEFAQMLDLYSRATRESSVHTPIGSTDPGSP
jgi:glycosyltransferase involved in cell wall biosynthesis